MVQHYRSIEELSINSSWITIGVFDGIHLGHQEMIKELTAGAHQGGVPAVVLTFFPHPAVTLGKQTGMKYLTTPDEKVEVLGNLGVDIVITETFTREMSQLSAQEFMSRLSQHLGIKYLIIGYDFALGKDRTGNMTRLTELGHEFGYRVQSFPAVKLGKETISSRDIRSRLAEGQVEKVAELMGRYYTVSGPIVHGDGRGRKINIPTANIDYVPEKMIPQNGVYACWALVGGERHLAVTNIGIRPTFTPDIEKAHIETHILDFDREIYDQELKLEFVKRLRSEKKFANVDDLLKQINEDITTARSVLGLDKSTPDWK